MKRYKAKIKRAKPDQSKSEARLFTVTVEAESYDEASKMIVDKYPVIWGINWISAVEIEEGV